MATLAALAMLSASSKSASESDALEARNAQSRHLEALIRRSNATLLPGVIRGNDHDHIDGARVTKEPSDS
jgi:hypothetical protein